MLCDKCEKNTHSNILKFTQWTISPLVSSKAMILFQLAVESHLIMQQKGI